MSLKKTCRLCVEILSDDNFEVIDEDKKYILDILLLKLNFQEIEDHIICSICSKELLEVFEFKSLCVSNNATIVHYADWQELSKLDLRDIYLKEGGHDYTVTLSEDWKVCRLCMKVAENGLLSLQKLNMEMLQAFFPEIDLNIIKDPVVCKTCFDAFEAHTTFLKRCLDIEKTNLSCLLKTDTHNQEKTIDCHIKTEAVNIKVKDEFLIESDKGKMGHFDLKCENSDQSFVKTEEIDIEDDHESYKPSMSSENNDMRAVESKNLTGNVKIKPKYLYNGRIYKCDTCNFETRHKGSLQKHRLIHKNASEVRMHRCSHCSFETRRKDTLNKHNLLHKDPSEVNMYKCAFCAYETRNKYGLDAHQVKHKSPSEVQMFKCDTCDFETRYKNSLRVHNLQHKNSSEVEMHKCDKCDYETKRKDNLRKHKLNHHNSTEVKMYKCDTCDFETRRKDNIKIHQIKHKSPSEVQMYKCDICDYTAKHKAYIRKHWLKHKSPSEVHMFKCDSCNYETRYKGILQWHQVKHKNPFEMQIYNCDFCDYKTQYKSSLNVHNLKHKNPAEVKMYKCDQCDFETKYKQNWERHQLSYTNKCD